MILFLDDWKKYPTAIVNTETTNISFLRLASLYREMGIKNHAFNLALIDRSLVGVDPFDPNLSLENQLKIAVECKLNPWFFFREILKAPAQAGSSAERFQANRGNHALFWSFFNHITIILIQIRQTGKSFSTDGLMTYLLNIRCKSTEINLLTKDDTLRSRNIQRLKEIDSELPFYLKQRGKGDINNTEELSIRALGNTYRAHVPQKSPKMAYNVGRGLSSPIFQIDEAPFQPNIGIALPAALAAGTALREKAALNDEPYGTIITTTAGKKDDKDGKYVYEMVQESAEWTERFFDCKDHKELEQMVRKNSRTGVARINATFNHIQLGKDNEWLRRSIEDANVKGEDADRDFFNIWTSGTQSSPVPVETLEKIRKSYIAPYHNSISDIGGYVTRWYVPENKISEIMNSRKTIASLDTSDASGGDDISLKILDVETGTTIASGTFNETNLIKFASWLAEDWIVKYPELTMIIERRSSGVAIIDYLLHILPSKGIDPFRRLFNRIVNDADEDPAKFAEINLPMSRRSSDIYERFKKAFGFATSGGGITSRTSLYSTTLQSAAKNIGDRVKDLATINQIAGLVTKNGRIDHQDGEHDDMVIAWLLAYWLLSQGKNLYFYGINSKNVLSSLIKHKPQSAEEAWQAKQQQEIRDKIEMLLKELKESRDSLLSEKIERELRSLNSKVVLQENEKFSVDDLINSIRDQKKNKTRESYFNSNTSNAPAMNQEQYKNYYRDPRKVF